MKGADRGSGRAASGFGPLPLAGLAVMAALAAGCSRGEGDGGVDETAPARETASDERVGAVTRDERPGEDVDAASGDAAAASKEAELNDPELVSKPSGLKYRDLANGTGREARSGDVAVVHYTGWLVDGTKFDSSLDRGQPFDFPVGGGRVIKGWDEGVAGMKVGGKRRLVIPPDLGYGSRGAGGVIPPDATLIFEVELLGVKPG